MFQLTALYDPPADPAAFDRYYDEVHLGLGVKLPGLQRLSVSRPGPDAEGNPPRYHLIAHLEWADEQAFQDALASPEGQATVADLPNFAGAGVTLLAGPSDTIV